jgi:hypothetical protein
MTVERPTAPPAVRAWSGHGGTTDTPSTALIGFDDITDLCPECRHVAYSCMAAAKDEVLLTTTESEGFVPCVHALKKWIEPPSRPIVRKSKWHSKAKQEGVTMLAGSFIAFILLGLVLGGGRFPAYWFLLFAAAALYFAGKAFFVNYLKARVEDQAMERAYESRLETWRERMSTYSRLYYCPHCATVHDCITNRRAAWYEFLDLMVYPDNVPATEAVPPLGLG